MFSWLENLEVLVSMMLTMDMINNYNNITGDHSQLMTGMI